MAAIDVVVATGLCPSDIYDLPEVWVVVQVEHVEGFLPLGEVLRLQELGPPCPGNKWILLSCGIRTEGVERTLMQHKA